VAAQLAAGTQRRRLIQVLLPDPEPLLFHGEIVRRDGAEVGYIRSASYGWTLGGAVGLAMVDAGGALVDQSWLDSGEWSVQVGDRTAPALVALRPRYDPAGQRIRR
jgi:glycine cleavage system aminomethyltransferase T